MGMAAQPPQTSSEEMALFRANTAGSQSVFFYIVLGLISGARKLLLKADNTGCSIEGTRSLLPTPAQVPAASLPLAARESERPTITTPVQDRSISPVQRTLANAPEPPPRSFFGKFQRPKK
jgi:hypothetical protein